jgi:hypothetical protein
VATAGGLSRRLYETGETDAPGVIVRVQAIGERLEEIWTRAAADGVAPQRMADRVVEERLGAARSRRWRGGLS